MKIKVTKKHIGHAKGYYEEYIEEERFEELDQWCPISLAVSEALDYEGIVSTNPRHRFIAVSPDENQPDENDENLETVFYRLPTYAARRALDFDDDRTMEPFEFDLIKENQ